jgi:hypothetical protein
MSASLDPLDWRSSAAPHKKRKKAGGDTTRRCRSKVQLSLFTKKHGTGGLFAAKGQVFNFDIP